MDSDYPPIRPLVFTNGCFEIFHYGHLRLLESAKQMADGGTLLVGLNSDDSFRAHKGRDPLVCARVRAEILRGLRCVDGVIIFEKSSVRELVQRVKPDILVKGGDYQWRSHVVGHDLVEDVRLLNFENGWSSTEMIRKLREMYDDGEL